MIKKTVSCGCDLHSQVTCPWKKNGLRGRSSPSPQTETLHPPLLHSNRPFISTQRLGVAHKTSWWQLFREKLWKKAYISATSMKTIHLDWNKMGGFCACVCAGHPSPPPASALFISMLLFPPPPSIQQQGSLRFKKRSEFRPKAQGHGSLSVPSKGWLTHRQHWKKTNKS